MKKLFYLLPLILWANSLNAQLFSYGAGTPGGGVTIETDALGNIYKGGYANPFGNGWSLEKYANNGTLLWQVQDGGTSQGGIPVLDIAVAANGDVYVTVSTRPGSHIGVDSLIVSGVADEALIKYNSQGQLQWYKTLTGNANDTQFFSAISITSTGNVVAQGYYSNSAIFDGQALNRSGSNIFWGVFDPNGNRIAIQEYTASTALSWDSELDGNDNLIISGYNTATNQMTVFKMDLSGNLLWSWSPTSGSLQMISLHQDLTGAIYVTGQLSSAVTINGTTYTPVSVPDVFVFKLTASGVFRWFRKFGGVNIEGGRGITTNADCDVFITGDFTDNSDFDGITLGSPGNGVDAFFAELDSAGTLKWATNGGGSGNDSPGNIAYDSFGDRALSTGILTSNANINFGPYNLVGSIKGYLVALSSDASRLTGKVFRDNNNNGVYDAGDQDFPNVMVRTSPGVYWTTSSANGEYNQYTGLGSFTVDLPNVPSYYTFSGASSHSAVFSAYGQLDQGNDFALYPTSNINDLRVTLSAYRSTLRSSGQTGFRLTYENVGTTFLSGASISFNYDPALTMLPTFPLPTSTGSGTATWALPTLYPGDVDHIYVEIDAPMLTIGTLQSFNTAITHPMTEQTPLDNVDTLVLVVSNSYDPNDKSVLPAGALTPTEVAAGPYLNYTIRFQNTGNDTAYFVRLRDTLSDNLDLGTFEWQSESHPAVWTIDPHRVLTVDFYDIDLLDSTSNEPESHGFFRYRVKPLATLVDGDEIDNTAAIYFDFNPPIITNTTHTPIATPLGVEGAGLPSVLRVYPVPASDLLHFDWRESGHQRADVHLMDAYGRALIHGTLDGMGGELNLSGIAAGIYFYQIVEKGALLQSGKVIVKK